jgi:hypothetical protein
MKGSPSFPESQDLMCSSERCHAYKTIDQEQRRIQSETLRFESNDAAQSVRHT